MQTGTSKLSAVIAPAVLVVVLSCMYAAHEVVVPVALACLLAFLLTPIDKFLQKHGLPKGLSVGLISLTSLLIIGINTWVVTAQVKEFAQQLPTYKGNIKKRIEDLRQNGDGSAPAKARATVEEVVGKSPPTRRRSRKHPPRTRYGAKRRNADRAFGFVSRAGNAF